jgi:hypothetical protein
LTFEEAVEKAKRWTNADGDPMKRRIGRKLVDVLSQQSPEDMDGLADACEIFVDEWVIYHTPETLQRRCAQMCDDFWEKGKE